MTLPDMQFRLSANDQEALAALRRMRSEIGGLSDVSRRASGSTRDFSSAAAASTGNNRRFTSQVQNAAFQVGDFAVQVNGGTSAIRAMSQQLPQLLGAFGVFGAVAGAAFAILAPLVGKLFEGGEAAEGFARDLDASNSSLESVRGTISSVHQVQERLVAALNASAGASAAGASAIVANSQAEFDARKQVLGVELELLRVRQGEMREQLRNLRDQQRVLAASAAETLRTLGPGATASRTDGSSGFAGERRSYNDYLRDIDPRLGENDRTIRRTSAELELLTVAADEASAALSGVFTTPGTVDGGGGSGGGAGGGGSGGGGGGVPQKTPVETAIERHIKAIQQLKEATGDGLSDAASAWSTYFDDIVTRSGSSNERLLAIAKSFGAASALVDAWQAHNAVLKDPTLPWWARIASAAQVLASGLGAVNAIRGVTAGGGGGAASGGGGGAPAAAAGGGRAAPLEALIRLQGPNARQFADNIGPVFDALLQEAGDRGIRPVFVAG